MELGAVLASTFKVGVDFIDIWRILFVVCDLKDKKQMEVKHNQLVPKKRIYAGRNYNSVKCFCHVFYTTNQIDKHQATERKIEQHKHQ